MKPPYFTLTGICRSERCDNHGKEFIRQAKKSTYEATDGVTKTRTDVSCPNCLSWSKIIRIEEVTE